MAWFCFINLPRLVLIEKGLCLLNRLAAEKSLGPNMTDVDIEIDANVASYAFNFMEKCCLEFGHLIQRSNWPLYWVRNQASIEVYLLTKVIILYANSIVWSEPQA